VHATERGEPKGRELLRTLRKNWRAKESGGNRVPRYTNRAKTPREDHSPKIECVKARGGAM